MAVPVFVYRPNELRARDRLERLIDQEQGEVAMEAETPNEHGEIMLLVGFEDDLTADAFVRLANILDGVTAEKSMELRVAGEVLYGE
jgi:hypothetical protein